jgi:outer membrane protein OmpA-like peptidoglycan-associated protein
MKKVNFILIIIILSRFPAWSQESIPNVNTENWADYYFVNEEFEKVNSYYSNSKESKSLRDYKNWGIALYELDLVTQAADKYEYVVNAPEALIEDYYYFSNLLINQPRLAKEYRDKSLKLPLPSPGLYENDSLLFKERFESEYYSVKSVLGNTDGSEFGMVFLNTKEPLQVLFLSEQAKTTATRKVLKRIKTEYPIYNFYRGTFDKTKFSLTKSDDSNSVINSLFQEGPGFYNDKTDLFYFTRSSNKWDKNRRVHLNLYQMKLSEITKNKVPIPLSVNGIDFSSLHPSINKSGTVMYFSSNRPGGYGGMDLYRVFISNGVFSEPINLGSDINTEGDEVFPYSYNDQFLFYSSNGKGSQGAMDIFLAENKFETRWQSHLLGKGINSKSDDFSFSLNEKLSLGVFSSDKEGGKGKDDLYAFNFNPKIEGISDHYEFIPSDTLIVAHNNVLVNDEKKLVREDPLQRLIKKEVILSKPTSFGNLKLNKNGSFLYKNIVPSSKKDSFAYKVKTVKGTSEDVWVFLNRSKVEQKDLPPAILDAFLPIYYDLDGSSLLDSYKVRVDKVVSVMQANPNLEIELRSYTDCRGSLEYNLKLSERRNQEIIKYVQKRIDKPERIYGKGYGEDIGNSEFNMEFGLVVGSFKEVTKVQSLVVSLEAKGYAPIIESYGLYYRVIAIQKDSRKALYQSQQKLNSLGYKTWVLTNPCLKVSEEEHQKKRRTDFEVIKL